ncbi:metal-dependent hydrolase [Candidatus Woesearchaeota archaeon]|nr:metal-dependent hydrolase [Candidatus Woesearchaeota archaeon]
MEPFVHALIPLAFLLALFPNLDKKYIFYLVPIVWIIDLDTFIGLHRFTFHNLTFILALAGIAYIIFRNRTAFWVACYYGISHLILDLALPGVAFFYPFYQKTFYLNFSLTRVTQWIVDISAGTLSLDQFQALLPGWTEKTYIGEASILFIILFAIILLVRYKKEIKETTQKWINIK